MNLKKWLLRMQARKFIHTEPAKTSMHNTAVFDILLLKLSARGYDLISCMYCKFRFIFFFGFVLFFPFQTYHNIKNCFWAGSSGQNFIYTEPNIFSLCQNHYANHSSFWHFVTKLSVRDYDLISNSHSNFCFLFFFLVLLFPLQTLTSNKICF